MLCESGERVTSRMNEIDLYEEFDWYTFPHKVQQLLPTTIINMKKTLAIEAFGNIPCTRETFKKVIRMTQFNSCQWYSNEFILSVLLDDQRCIFVLSYSKNFFEVNITVSNHLPLLCVKDRTKFR